MRKLIGGTIAFVLRLVDCAVQQRELTVMVAKYSTALSSSGRNLEGLIIFVNKIVKLNTLMPSVKRRLCSEVLN